MYNEEIRNLLKKYRIYHYELAAAMGIAEQSLSRMLARRELSENEKSILISRIEEIKRGIE